MTELLERADALHTLQQQLQAAHTRGRVALVSGEAGIGKSSLLQALAATHANVWWGRCDALSTPHPLAPLLDIARDAQPRFASRLTLPRPALFDAVLDELRAAQTPMLVVVEDAHWADDATLDLLKFLARRIDSARVLLVISYRDDEIAMTHPLRRVLGDLPTATLTRLNLPRLSEQAVRTLARQSQRSAYGVFEATLGNPFFVTELLREAGVGVPGTVHDLVLSRFARLGASQQAVLRLTSIVPGRIEHWLLHAVLAPSGDDLEACLGSGLLQIEGPYLRFRHELARVAIESSMQAPIAQAMHQRLLDTMQGSERAVPVARLAHHAALADDDAAVRRFAPAAAEEAAAKGSLREAARHWQAALNTVPAPGEEALRHGWLECQAQACRQLPCLDDGLAARQQLDAAFSQAGDVRNQALNLSMAANLHAIKTHDTEANIANRRAIDLLKTLPPGPEMATVHGVEGLLRLLNREYDACLAWCRSSVDVARRFGDRERELHSLATAATAMMFVDYEAACDQAKSLLDAARQEGRHAVVATLLTSMGAAAAELMQLASARRWLQQAIACAAEHELDGSLYYAQALMSLCELRLGLWNEASERATAVVERPAVWPTSRVIALVTLGTLRVRRGDPGTQALLGEALALAGSSEALQRFAPVSAMRAEAAWLAGDAAGCDVAVRAALESAQARRHPWFIGELAAWRWRADTVHEVPADCASPYALEMEGHWQEAADMWRLLGCPYEQAGALARGDAAAQQQALALYEQLGGLPAAEALRRRMRQAGVRGVTRGVRDSTRAHPCGLTRAEMQVLALMREDLRNADIAARLHRSVRTVDHHVASVLAKLQVGTRHEAVRRAERENWVAQATQVGQLATAR
jgi:DNA-binding CsgD family transcriptional regulator